MDILLSEIRQGCESLAVEIEESIQKARQIMRDGAEVGSLEIYEQGRILLRKYLACRDLLNGAMARISEIDAKLS